MQFSSRFGIILRHVAVNTFALSIRLLVSDSEDA